jgi:arginyl-tRNA synthetase
MNPFKNQVAKALTQASGKTVKPESLDVPPDSKLGDASSRIAFELPGNPVENAKAISKKIKKASLIKEVQAKGPYVNFFINYDEYTQLVLEQAVKKEYGATGVGKGKTVVIDYSSPNIAKPFTVGHLRSTNIGQCLYNVHDFLGFHCVGVNHLGDWGTQFGKLIVAYKKWGDKEKIQDEPIKELLALYVKFHENETDELNEEAREWFKKLEDGDPEAVKLWEWFKKESLKKFDTLYERLGVKFDEYKGESFYSKSRETLNVIDEALEKKVAKKEEDGSVVIEFPGLTNGLLQKSDEATLYLTREIACAKHRKKQHGFDKSLYVVGSEQTLHFRQLKQALKLLGYSWWNQVEHVAFGLVTLPGGKMSTRKGKVVFLEDVLDKAVSLAEKTVQEKNPDLPEKQKKMIAEAVGIGAIKFGDLSHNRVKQVKFDWKQMLDLEGDTAPYLQYAHARCHQILAKLEKSKDEPDYKALKTVHERELVKLLGSFPDVLEQVAGDSEPHQLAVYLIRVAHQFSDFYNNCPVIQSTGGLKEGRTRLVKASMNVLSTGLSLLGVKPLEKM